MSVIRCSSDVGAAYGYRWYYWNPKHNETFWTPPPDALIADPVWVKIRTSDERPPSHYYWLSYTMQTQHGAPPGVDVEWNGALDKGSGDMYYWRRSSRQTTWTVPTSLSLPTETAGSIQEGERWFFVSKCIGRGLAVAAQAAATGAAGSRCNASSRKRAAARTEDSRVTEVTSWVLIVAPNGETYFWNYATNESVQQLPTNAYHSWELNHGGNNENPVYRNVHTAETVLQPPNCRRRVSGYGDLGPGDAWLEKDAAVVLRGKVCGRYEGQVGKVGNKFEDVLEVHLPDCLGGVTLEVPPKCVAALESNTLVGFHNIQQEPSLNHRVGYVREAVVEDGVGKYILRVPELAQQRKVRCTKIKPTSPFSNLDITASPPCLQWGGEQNCIFRDSEGKCRNFRIQLPLHFPMGQETGQASDAGECPAWPLIVYFHGAGSASFYGNSKKSLCSPGLEYAAAHFVVVSPICDWKWREQPRPWINELVHALRAADWIDPNRIYATGFSMGGMSTWEVAAEKPDLYAAIAPVAAHHQESRTTTIAERLCRTPVLVVHSTTDTTCPQRLEEPLWRALEECAEGAGGNSLLQVELAAETHCRMFQKAFCDDTMLYRWLLRFARSQ